MNNAKSKTSLVLMELIITILFFSIASAVCVQLFVKSHLLTKETDELNNAVGICQSIAEVMNGTDGSLYEIKPYFPSAEGEDNYFVIYYDDSFKPTLDVDNYTYFADVTVTSVGKLSTMDINFIKHSDMSSIYSIRASKYIR